MHANLPWLASSDSASSRSDTKPEKFLAFQAHTVEAVAAATAPYLAEASNAGWKTKHPPLAGRVSLVSGD